MHRWFHRIMAKKRGATKRRVEGLESSGECGRVTERERRRWMSGSSPRTETPDAAEEGIGFTFLKCHPTSVSYL